MSHDSDQPIRLPTADDDQPCGAADSLTEVLREGARRLLAQAVEAEVEDYIGAHADRRDTRTGRRLVVRNGHMPARVIQTPLGDIKVRQPRVDDRRLFESDDPTAPRFSSDILPKYLRRTRAIDRLIPWLYLKGISSSDFGEALGALLGKEPRNLSPNVIMRLKEVWREEWEQWSLRSLQDKRYVYLWADGVYFNVRQEDRDNSRQCILVIVGATAAGKKELVAVADGYRECEQSWLEVLRDLKRRGLECTPGLCVGDGALGFWKALRQVFAESREQRCWVHKTANVLSKLPLGRHPAAKRALKAIWTAATRKEADETFDVFLSDYNAKYPKAAECLEKDRDELLRFYDFPARHWKHLRTTNPIESTFATVRLRTDKTKGSGTRQACLTMVFKLMRAAQRHWRPLDGKEHLADVIAGVKFADGVRQAAA